MRTRGDRRFAATLLRPAFSPPARALLAPTPSRRAAHAAHELQLRTPAAHRPSVGVRVARRRDPDGVNRRNAEMDSVTGRKIAIERVSDAIDEIHTITSSLVDR